MHISEKLVTPELAQQLLEKNVNNRRLQTKRVEKLSQSMSRGEWQFNGDTIRISVSGRLLDGQHRLAAIAKSGVPQRYIIVEGLNDESFTTIDIGSARNAGQMLQMTGAKHVTALAAAAKMHLLLESVGKPIHGNLEKQPTHTEIVDFAEASEDLKESAQFSNSRKWVNRYIGPSVGALCHFEFGRVSKMLRDAFFEELISGETSYQDSPIRFIRDLLIEERGSKYAPNRERRIALLFKSFRLYRESKPAKIVRLPKNQEEWFKL